MKRKSYVLLSLILTAFLGGLIIWNFSATGVSAQKSDDFGESPEVLTEYNARDEFALTQGGSNGLWNYGYSTSDADNTLNLFTVGPDTTTSAGCGGTFEIWRINNSDWVPQIARHNPAATCNTIPSNALFIHPGYNNQRAVLRFTAPTSGTFQITGTFQKQALGATSDLKIIKNAALPGETVLYTGVIGAAYQQAFDFTVTIAAGDKIDFSVGDAGDNTWQGDGSSIAVTIGQPITACSVASANLQVNVPAENSPADVRSVNTNASLVGDATYDNTGKVGRAFEFDGNGDYVRVEDNAAQRPATALTAEGWFKFDNTPGLTSLISKPIRGSVLNSYTLYFDGGQLRGLIGNSSQYTRALSSFTPQAGVWYHLAFTYDFTGGVSTLKLYANGVEVTSGVDGTANLPLYYDANPYPLLIGGEFEDNAPTFFLDGQADEVSIYGRALSQSEIFDIVQQGSFGKCSPGSACFSAPNGLVSFYKGEDNALDSNSLNPGTLAGGTTFQTGRVGRGFNFDGVDDFVAVSDSNSLDITGDLTIEAWVNPTTNPAFSRIVSKRSLNDANAEYDLLRQADGRLRFSSINGSTDNFVISSSTVPAGTFTHVAVTIQSGTLRFYINGALDSTYAYSFTRTATAGRLTIGAAEATACGGSGACSFFAGQIDELSFYNRALSASEISSIAGAGANGKCLAYTCAQLPNNLVSWFAGEENALDSRSNNHGALVNGTTFQTGRVGQGFKFDGANDYVEIPDSPSLKPQTLTVETWVKFDSLHSNTSGGAANGTQYLIFKKNQSAGNFEGFVLYKNSDNKFRFGFGQGNGNPGTVADSTTVATTGVFYHVVGTYDGSAAKIYVNGQLEASVPYNLPLNYDTRPLFLGTSGENFDGKFNGVLDETSIYNRALTATEISSIYNADSSGKCKPTGLNPAANLVGFWTGDGDARDFQDLDQNGTNNGATFSAGKVGQSFTFTADPQNISIPDSAAMRPANFTAEMWTKSLDNGGTKHILAKAIGTGTSNSYVLWVNNGALNGMICATPSSCLQISTAAPNTGEWHHLALSFDDGSDSLRIYIDGVQAVSGTTALSIGYDAHPVLIGADIFNDGPIVESWRGQIDEVSFYDRALSTSEIAAVYNAGVAGKLKSAITPVNFGRNAKTAASLAPTIVQLSSATVTFTQVTSAGTTSQSGADLGLLPNLPSNVTTNNLNYDLSTTAAYSGNVTVCFNVPSIPAGNFTETNILHLENGVWESALPNTITRNYPQICGDFSSLSPFAVVQGLAPSAAGVSLSGRVVAGKGQAVANALIHLTDQNGNTRAARTNHFGFYRFLEVEAGQTYVVNAYAKRYQFQPQVVFVGNEMTLDLTPIE